jgi:hypothetical protein
MWFVIEQKLNEWRDEVGTQALRRMPGVRVLQNNVAYALALSGRPGLARRYVPDDEDVYSIATESLIALQIGDKAAGEAGYDRAAEVAESRGDYELAQLVRLQKLLVMARQRGEQLPEPIMIELKEAAGKDDVRYAVLWAVARSLTEKNDRG